MPFVMHVRVDVLHRHRSSLDGTIVAIIIRAFGKPQEEGEHTWHMSGAVGSNVSSTTIVKSQSEVAVAVPHTLQKFENQSCQLGLN